MFQSDSEKNLLFKDSTKCLQEIEEGISVEQFLGDKYVDAMTSLRVCSKITPGLYHRRFNQYKHLQ